MIKKVNNNTKRNTITVTYTDANMGKEYSFLKESPVCPHCHNEIYNIGICEYTCTECGIIFECRGDKMQNIGELIISHDAKSADMVQLTREIEKQDKYIKDLEHTIESLRNVILMRYNYGKEKNKNGKE